MLVCPGHVATSRPSPGSREWGAVALDRQQRGDRRRARGDGRLLVAARAHHRSPCSSPMLSILRYLQRRQLAGLRRRARPGWATRCRSSRSRSVGAAVIRAYGAAAPGPPAARRRDRRQYRPSCARPAGFALMFPLGDVFGAVALSRGRSRSGCWNGPAWGLERGRADRLPLPGEPAAQPDRRAQRGPRPDPDRHRRVAQGASTCSTCRSRWSSRPTGPSCRRARWRCGPRGLRFAYRTGPEVLHAVDVDIPAGTPVAVVGETGSGKTTFAKLLCRLADPTAGRHAARRHRPAEVAAASRPRPSAWCPRTASSSTPRSAENAARSGRPGATDDERRADGVSIASLGLAAWLDGAPGGPRHPGRRAGRAPSRSASASSSRWSGPSSPTPACSSSTRRPAPSTPRPNGARGRWHRLAAGRTTVSVAHRLSTAEDADLVLVFDRGRLVEHGPHAELVAAGGTYARLHESWLGNTRSDGSPPRESGQTGAAAAPGTRHRSPLRFPPGGRLLGDAAGEEARHQGRSARGDRGRSRGCPVAARPPARRRRGARRASSPPTWCGSSPGPAPSSSTTSTPSARPSTPPPPAG